MAGVKFTLTNAHPLELDRRRGTWGSPWGSWSRSRTGRSSTSPATLRVRRHADHHAPLRAGRRDPPDRGPLHHGSQGSRARPRVSPTNGRCIPATTAPSRRSGDDRPSSASSRRTSRWGRDGARRLAHGMRERWWGAGGRRVPEIAVEGDPAVPRGGARRRRARCRARITRGVRGGHARRSARCDTRRRCVRRSPGPRWRASSCRAGATCSSST